MFWDPEMTKYIGSKKDKMLVVKPSVDLISLFKGLPIFMDYLMSNPSKSHTFMSQSSTLAITPRVFTPCQIGNISKQINNYQ